MVLYCVAKITFWGQYNYYLYMLAIITYNSMLLQEDGVITGLIRAQINTTQVTLYADDVETAELLMRGLMTSYPQHGSSRYYMTAPACSVPPIMDMMKSLQLKTDEPYHNAYRMATDGPPQGIPWHKVYSYLNIACVLL